MGAVAPMSDVRWVGPSGLPVAGVQVAEGLAAAVSLLEKKGWVRRTPLRSESAGPLGRVNDATSIREMVRALVSWLCDEITADLRDFTLTQALGRVNDRDTYAAATSCLETVLAGRLGVDRADVDAWAGRPERTFAEVRDLVEASAEFARVNGPEVHA